jgi:ankyrin repeat protein
MDSDFDETKMHHRENVERVFNEGLMQSIILGKLRNVYCVGEVQACVSLQALKLVSKDRLKEHFEKNLNKKKWSPGLNVPKEIACYVPQDVYCAVRRGLASLKHLDAWERGDARDFSYDRTALVHACAAGVDVEYIDRFFGIKDVISKRICDNKSALKGAIEYGHVDIVRYLLSKEKQFSDLMDRERDVREMFLHACQSRSVEILKFLLNEESIALKLNSASEAYWRAMLLYACRSGSVEVVKFLLDEESIALKLNSASEVNVRNMLLRACHDGSVEILKFLLDTTSAKKYVNESDKTGKTALMVACRSGSLDSVTLLLNTTSSIQGVNERDMFGQTVLMHACQSGCVDIVKILLDSTSAIDDVNAKDKYGRTALMRACHAGCVDTVSLLLDTTDAIQEVHAKDWDGTTAFKLAQRHTDLPELALCVQEASDRVDTIDCKQNGKLTYPERQASFTVMQRGAWCL